MKKKLVSFFIILFISRSAFAQHQLIAYDYWFDNNFAAKVHSTISPVNTYHLNTAFPITGLSLGLHTFTIRFEDENSQYSNAQSGYFYNSSSEMLGYEYWFDNNYTTMVSQTVAPTQLININNDISISGISPGLHTFSLRAKTTNGDYSNPVSAYFYLGSPKITGYEYWFDNNYDLRVTQSVSPNQNFLMLQDLDVSGINPGLHIFNIRFHDENLSWSNVKSAYFTKLGQPVIGNIISSYRYWFDDGDTTMVNISVPTAAKIVQLNAPIPVPVLAGSTHRFNIQFRDTTQMWTAVLTDTITTCSSGIPPSVGPITGNDTICEGSSNTYSIPLDTNVSSYNWILPAGWTGTSNTNSIIATAGANGGVISVTTANTCGTSAAQSFSVTVNPLANTPTPIIGDTSVCKGTVNIYSVVYDSSAISYTWNLPNGWIGSSTSNSLTAIAGTSGGNISVSANNSCGSSATQILPVDASPISSTMSITSSSTVVNTFPMQVTFSINSPLSNYSYVWYFGDGSLFSGNLSSVTHTYNFNGVYTVSLLRIDTLTGCSDTLVMSNYIICNSNNADSCSHTVSLNPSGVLNACIGSNIPLHSNTSLSNATYQWNRNGVIIGGASQDSYLADLSGNYSLTVFNSEGCPVTSAPIQINYSQQVNVPPVISSSGTVNSCGNVNVILTASGNFPNYVWSTGQTGNNINVTQGGSYTVTGQDTACDAVSLPYLINGSVIQAPPICMITVDETDNKNIVIWEKPTSLQIDKFLILREDINNLGVYNIIASQPYNELSEFKDTGSYANLRAYRYKIAVEDTCGGISIPSSSQRSMHLNVEQGNNILSRQLTWNVYQGQPQAFSNYLIYREDNAGLLTLLDSVPSWQTWYYDASLTNISDTGRVYKIGYMVTSPCISTRAQNNFCFSNLSVNQRPFIEGQIESEDFNFDWNLNPNPNSGLFYINCNRKGYYEIEIFNLLGEVVYQKKINFDSSAIDFTKVGAGIYLVRLNNESEFSTKRMVITK